MNVTSETYLPGNRASYTLLRAIMPKGACSGMAITLSYYQLPCFIYIRHVSQVVVCKDTMEIFVSE